MHQQRPIRSQYGRLLGWRYPHSRHKVLLRSYWWRASGVGEEPSWDASQAWQRVCIKPEIVGCSNVHVRNKNLPGFTTNYKVRMKRPPQLGVLN
jgi:hypothetical protein